jgi:hypothetical protein
VNVSNVIPALPSGNFDTPVSGVTGVVGAIPVTGWALDNIEVTHVDIFREPVTGETPDTLTFIGTATFSADARPDVESLLPTSPLQYRAGWGYQLLTNVLPNSSGSGAPGNGVYKLHAVAYDKAGLQLDLGTRTMTVDNAHATKPFGAIDTPTQGGTISGANSVNFGWALTPQTAMIPIDGSTITVVIDGVLSGNPTYNQFRNDIASFFPGYKNSNGAVGFFYINTTELANGVHTISWNVFDDLGRGAGLGSRYFTVQNTSGGVAAPVDLMEESATGKAIQVRNWLEPQPPARANRTGSRRHILGDHGRGGAYRTASRGSRRQPDGTRRSAGPADWFKSEGRGLLLAAWSRLRGRIHDAICAPRTEPRFLVRVKIVPKLYPIQ